MEETTPQASTPSSRRGLTTIIAVVIIALLVVGGFVVFNMNKPANPQPPTTEGDTAITKVPTKEESSPSGTMKSNEGAKTISVSGQNFSFSPNTITVKKGETVTLEFKSAGGFHNFVVDELNVRTPVIESGKTATVTFTPTKVGTFEFYCSVGNHRAMGMKGTLVVE